MTELLTIKEASEWASRYLNKNVTTSNISYLIQYGKVRKHGNNGTTAINKYDLITYYKNYNGKREINWKIKLGKDRILLPIILRLFLSFISGYIPHPPPSIIFLATILSEEYK